MQYIVFNGCIALSSYIPVSFDSSYSYSPFITLLFTLPYLQLNSFVPIVYSALLCQCINNIYKCISPWVFTNTTKIYTSTIIIHGVVCSAVTRLKDTIYVTFKAWCHTAVSKTVLVNRTEMKISVQGKLPCKLTWN